MKVLVTVTDVAVVDDEFEIDGLGVDERYLTYELNEWDDYAVEEAVQIAEAGEGVEVVTVTVGPERSEETVRKALAKGADRAVRVWDDAIADRELLDAETKAELLAAVAREEEPDLILSGVQSGDDSFAATGVTLAEKLGEEWAAVVNQLELDADAGVASVHRELEGGVEELTDVELPAVLTIQTGINEPRYASLRGIRQAQNKPLDVKALDDLGLDESALETPLRWTATYEPESEGDATVFEGGADETAGELAAVLREEGVGQ
ncbi:electron transfer flavoprotein subunit beta/FixA family protein [Halosimplex pelagicum]|uniref:Electron transfer flavoprotein subunit beta/FixA family protein n=1 Tax=Halosimplex pelagicum TaxID=869886 RepID=A0A7D5P7L0_9EURY|nr:electron transfer flavoprotein subunit beta/FixA family protein [Halosimplex pelagicum]QLH80524.1 electron transfer flavoprotein subunit beta/FixA family protein [Halosimplex pelagicum]